MVKTVGQSATWQLFGLFVKLKKIVYVVLNQLSEWLKSCQSTRVPFISLRSVPQVTFPAIAGECVARGCGGVNQLIRFVLLQIIAILGYVLSMVFNTQKHKWFTCYDVVV